MGDSPEATTIAPESVNDGTATWVVPGASRLEQATTWLFTHHRRRFVWIMVAITAAGVECVVPVLVLAIGPVFADGPGTIPQVMKIIIPASLLGVPALCWVVVTHHGPAIRYLRGDDPAPPPDEVWRTSVAELAKGVFYIVCGYWVPLTIGAIIVGLRLHASVALTFVFVYAVAMCSGLVGVFFFLVWETALRPLAREVAPSLSPDILRRSRGPSISIKLFILLTLTSLFNGFIVGSMALVPASHETRAILAVLISIAVSITLSGSVIWLLRHSFVTRIEEIRRALDLVESGVRGGLSLAPLAGDDLDDVTKSFNDMIRQLRQREDDMLESRARIVTVADAERRRMERDLHDGAQQYLSLLKLQLSSLEQKLGAADAVADLKVSVDQALEELRNLAHGIYPGSLESGGLPAALQDAARRAALPTHLESDGVERLGRDVEAAVYFCCLEALQNAGKYAGEGARATIALSLAGDQLQFSVTDNGAGFDAESDGHGLINMRDRIGALGGDVAIRSKVGDGTTVSGWVPVG